MKRLAPLLLLAGCALLRSPSSQTTPTSADGARVCIIVVNLFGTPHVVAIDQSGAVAGQTGAQKADQTTKVDAKADVKVPVIP